MSTNSVKVQRDFEEAVKVVDAAIESAHNNKPSTSTLKTYDEAKQEISSLCKELGTAMKKLGVNKSNVIQVGSSSKDIANTAQKVDITFEYYFNYLKAS
jgi:arabinogalactan endo-1,4-beta-galactosidase